LPPRQKPEKFWVFPKNKDHFHKAGRWQTRPYDSAYKIFLEMILFSRDLLPDMCGFLQIMASKKPVMVFIAVWLFIASANGSAFNYQFDAKDTPPSQWKTVVGWIEHHTVTERETLLDVARDNGLGWNELEILYPAMDPWVPDEGKTIDIPKLWILPSAPPEGIIVNIPELRLYRYIPGANMVETYPVGIGTEEYQTPTGDYKVVDRKENPVWRVPPSLREKYSFEYLGPGPENPLGKYWLGLSAEHIGIHGTNFPWAVGRQVSRGCIRLYPEHIEQLFPVVRNGTRVQIVYEPVKIGVLNREIYIEVHPDSEGNETDLQKYTSERLQGLGDGCYVSQDMINHALEEKNGVPIVIGTIQGGGDETASTVDQTNGNTSNETDK
jgi:L,D-transpeptidase ErfK/SrfK